jgi:hypothetical protein
MTNPDGSEAGIPKLPPLTSAADGTEPKSGVGRGDSRPVFAIVPDDVDCFDETLAWVILLALLDDLLADFAPGTPRRRVKRQRNARHCTPVRIERTAVARPTLLRSRSASVPPDRNSRLLIAAQGGGEARP